MKEPETVYLDIPATLKHLNIVGASLAALLERVEGLNDVAEQVYNAQLAVQEACVNIVDHAYNGEDGRIRIALEIGYDPLALTVTLQDTGIPFTPHTIPFPDLENGQVHGYGLFLMRELMDKVTYNAESDYNQWILIKNL